MASYYDLYSHDTEDEQDCDVHGLPLTNLCAAAAYIGSLILLSGMQYAIMGGLAMVCRGSSRATADVDIATNASMKQLWKIVEPSPGAVLPRLVIPNTKMLDKSIRIFVRTGPSYSDSLCATDELVEVDVSILGGKHGPSEPDLQFETFTIDLQGQIFYLNVLNIQYMMRTKLRTLVSRSIDRDFDDIDFLLKNYGEEVLRIAERVNLEDRIAFVNTDVIQGRGPVAVRQYQKLLQL